MGHKIESLFCLYLLFPNHLIQQKTIPNERSKSLIYRFTIQKTITADINLTVAKHQFLV